MPDADRYIQDIAASNLLFDAAERASWRVHPEPMPEQPHGEMMWAGALLGFFVGMAMLGMFNSTGVTGLAVNADVEYVRFDFSAPAQQYLVGEPITFQVEPAGAYASIAYVRSDGGIIMLNEPKFIPHAPGKYTFNALVSAKGLVERKIITVNVLQNPILAAEQRVAEIARTA